MSRQIWGGAARIANGYPLVTIREPEAVSLVPEWPVLSEAQSESALPQAPAGLRNAEMKTLSMKALSRLTAIALAGSLASAELPANAETPAKQLFGRMTLPSNSNAASHGFYSKGCLAGAVAIPVDGPDWQVMRLSRNRRWGHPELVSILEQLSVKAKRDGWNGLLVGDMSQPRGGPMLTGHASHQIGLDADIWLTPMPNKRMTYQERENTSAISVLSGNGKGPYVDDRRWTKAHEALLRDAASFGEVERILVHPGIKKKLCDTVKGDRAWLNKIRPYWGHHYHFHIRIGCQPGSPGCRSQKGTGSDIGCGDALNWWFNVGLKPPEPSKKPSKPAKPKPQLTLSGMPDACAAVLKAPAKSADAAEFKSSLLQGFAAPAMDMPARVDPLAVLSSKPIEAASSSSALSVAGSVLSAMSADRLPVPEPRPLR